MRYLDVCSGISAPTQAWADLGFQCAGYAEIDAFPRAVLQERYGAVAVDWEHRHVPGSNVTPLFGDFTKIEPHHVGPVDLLVGGTPCQAFSVAGKRLGLDDPRGNLTLEFLALARRLRVEWLVWENVPGFLSHDEGRTMGTFLRLLGELGYGFAYRVLDAQFIRVDGHERAVPQRRRRLFVVGHLGDAAGPAAILFERESLRGDPAPRRQAGQGTAPTLSARTKGGGGLGTDFDCDGGLVAGTLGTTSDDWSRDNIGEGVVAHPIAASLTRGAESAGKGGYAGRRQEDDVNLVAHALRAEGFDASEDGTGRGTPLVPVEQPVVFMERGRPEGRTVEARQDGTANTILTPNGGRGGMGVGAIAFAQNSRDEVRMLNGDGSISGALSADEGMKQRTYIAQEWAVRRLTPRECERLMGFSDDFTLITYRGKPAADGPRYKALGNSQARNQMRWIGRGLIEVATALRERREAA